MSNKYELRSTTVPGSDWVEVSRDEWIRAERAAGFRPKMASDDPRYMQTQATGGFSSSAGTEGRIKWADDGND